MADVVSYRHEKPGNHPPNLYPGYTSTVKRAPRRGAIPIEHTLSEVTGPGCESGWMGASTVDLTRCHQAAPIGERIIVAGRVLDESGRAVAGY